MKKIYLTLVMSLVVSACGLAVPKPAGPSNSTTSGNTTAGNTTAGNTGSGTLSTDGSMNLTTSTVAGDYAATFTAQSTIYIAQSAEQGQVTDPNFPAEVANLLFIDANAELNNPQITLGFRQDPPAAGTYTQTSSQLCGFIEVVADPPAPNDPGSVYNGVYDVLLPNDCQGNAQTPRGTMSLTISSLSTYTAPFALDGNDYMIHGSLTATLPFDPNPPGITGQQDISITTGGSETITINFP